MKNEITGIEMWNMDINENIVINTKGIEYFITRVPGGWIYNHIRLDSNSMTSTFVPLHNEYI